MNRQEDWRAGGFGLYIHWPFCAAKCPYCDFNSHVTAQIDQKRWLDAYRAEINRLAAHTPDRILNSIFFGGGTPSLMDPDIVAGTIEAVRAAWPFANDMEISLEANPTSVEAGRFRAYAEGGVNRLSMGIQSLRDKDLRALGRMHSAAEAKAAFDIARSSFPRVSFDLIYARQQQTRQEWAAELREAIDMAVDHLSLYQLSIEPGTAFGARHAAGGLKGLPDEDLSADLWEETQEICAAAGMPGYEISNHAPEGSESRHNRIYWRQGDWAAIGPGAHGRITEGGTRYLTEAVRAPGEWLKLVESNRNGDLPWTIQNDADRAVEYLLMGLRLHEGISLERLLRMDPDILDIKAMAELEDMGLIEIDGDNLATTDDGRPVLNAILRQITK